MYPSRIKFWSEIYDYDYDFMPKNLFYFCTDVNLCQLIVLPKETEEQKKIKCQNWAIYNYLTHTYNRPQVGYCDLSCEAWVSRCLLIISMTTLFYVLICMFHLIFLSDHNKKKCFGRPIWQSFPNIILNKINAIL